MKPHAFSQANASASGPGQQPGLPFARVIVIGTGFSGLCMGVKLLEEGERDFLLLERAGDVGGTWRDNTYPGCACDVESHLYSFSFAANPRWSRMYAPQPEILSYLQGVARQFGLLDHVRFHANLTQARYDASRQRWVLQCEDGRRFECQVLVSGMGGLSNPAYPQVPGLDQFQGEQFHSATWRHDVDLSDKRVAVIGSGASAIQFVPAIAPKVAHLSYFQRTPPWVVPKMDRPIAAKEQADFVANPWRQQLARIKLYWTLELRFLAFRYRPQWMGLVAKVAKHKIRQAIRDPQLQAKLTPDYTPGCKRLLISNDYYPALARSNVEVITEGIQEVRAHSVVSRDGREHPVDAIIFGTGFKVQDPIPRGAVFGKDGQDLAEVWREGPQAFRGISVSGFPNFYMLMGPNTGLGHNSMVFMIESQVHYVMSALRAMREHALGSLEVRPQAQASDVDKVQQALRGTVWSSGCKSWYLNDKGRNTAAWPGFTFVYRLLTRRFPLRHYLGQPAVEQP